MMKRFLLIIAVIVLLTGCSKKEVETSPVSQTVPSPIHIEYMESSSIEQDTKGAVQQYKVSEGVEQLYMLNSGVALADSSGQIVVLSKENGSVIAANTSVHDILLAQKDRVVTFDPTSKSVVVYDQKLSEVAKYIIEEGIVGTPIAGGNEVFYCVNDHIRAISIESGLTRNVMQYVSADQFLTGCYFDGQMVGWNDGTAVIYLSSKDGRVLLQDVQIKEFATSENDYFGVYMDGEVEQRVWGALGGRAMQILLNKDVSIYPQMNCKSLITVKTAENGFSVDRYEMENGNKCGSLPVNIPGKLLDVVADEQYTWILTNDGLYRWEHTSIDDPESKSCLSPLISEDNPDTEALAVCAQRANTIGEKFGVDIRIWEDAILNNSDYKFTSEYQVQTIDNMLNDVEKCLGEIPDQLLKSTEEYCGFQICLVRSIEGYDYIQYRTNTGLCIAVTPDANMKEALFTGLGWGIDSHIIGNSRDLDYWKDLNPAGFEYDYSYFVNDHRTDLQYLEGEKRAFVDKRSMSFPSEDRARIFYYAITEGNQELFKSPILQAKLKTLCEGIREAYKWQKDPQSFPWEQYLEYSLAYK